MRKILLLAVLLSAPAFSQVKVNALPAGGAISGPNLTICDQSGTTNSCTFTQVSSYVLGNLTGTTVYGLFGCAGVATTFLNGAGGCTTPTGGASLGTANTWTALQTFGTNISIGGVTATGATGTGNNVFATSPTLVTPNLGTPSAITLTSATGLPLATGVTGTLQAAQEPAHTGDMTNTAGSLATTVVRINGTALSGLATGLLKNTTATGVPSIAASSDVIADWTGTCSSTTYLRGDGACSTPSGAGTVTTSGSPVSGNLATFSSSTAITTGNLSGDVTTSGTLAATVVKVNGAAVPTSAAVIASNSSNQFTALTLGGNLSIVSGVLAASQAINAQTGTSYTILTSDAGKLVTFSNASATAVTLPVATTTGFTAGFSFDVQNLGVGTVTITPTTSTINGSSTLTLAKNTGCTVTSDGTNYQVSACTALGSGGSSANPSATIGLSAVNGSATTFMTSDSAPALSQAIVPTWTGLHTFSLGADDILTGQTANTDVVIHLFENNTAATASNQQFACQKLTGFGWKTTATAASQQVDWEICNEPVQGAAAPTSNLVFYNQVAGGGYSAEATIGSNNSLTVNGIHTQSFSYISGTYAGGLDSAGHWRVGNTSTPTISSGACGTGTNGTLSAAANDHAGEIIIASATTTSCAVTFSAAYTTAPRAVLLQAANSAAATALSGEYVSAISTTGFTITGTLVSTSWYYWVQ